jgi:hypothetical protein
MLIKVKKVLIKAYNNIGLIKRYHALLCYIYKILKTELKNKYIIIIMSYAYQLNAIRNYSL